MRRDFHHDKAFFFETESRCARTHEGELCSDIEIRLEQNQARNLAHKIPALEEKIVCRRKFDYEILRPSTLAFSTKKESRFVFLKRD